MNIIMEWYNLLTDSLKAYPSLQAAFLTVMSGGVMAAVGFALVRLPRSVATFFRNQCLTSLVFNTASSGWSEYNQMQYVAFIKWFSKNRWFGWSRTITFDSDGRKDGDGVGPGLGRHFFFHNWRLFIFSISEMDSQGTSSQKYKVSLSCVGRSKKPIYAVMEEFMVKPDRENRIGVYRNGTDGWNWVTYANKRSLRSVIMSPELEEELVGSMTNFVNNEAWYRERGLNYKLTYLLYGPPGTGKSSLGRALASHFNRDLYILSLSESSDLLTLLQNAKGGMVLIEDIDGFSAARKRTGKKNQIESPKSGKKTVEQIHFDGNGEQIAPASPSKNLEDIMAEWGGMNTSALLNALDGVVGLDDVIILLSTNHPEKLDPALIRDGRVDIRVEVGLLRSPEIHRYINLFFPDYVVPEGVVFADMPGCTVQRHFMENKNNPEGFVQALLDASDGGNFTTSPVRPELAFSEANNRYLVDPEAPKEAVNA